MAPKAYDVVRYIPNCHKPVRHFHQRHQVRRPVLGNIPCRHRPPYKDQRCSPDNIAWEAEKEQITPWQAEWNVLLDSIS